MSQIKRIFLYSDFPSRSLSIQEIIDYVKDHGLSAQDRGNLFEFLDLTKEETLELAIKTAGMRVLDISEPIDEIHAPIFGEINAELERLKGKTSFLGVLDDGLWLQRILHK
ncbi:MAG: DUF6775 family putative metallopeptidase, partial [Thermodesulfobacteriota bacterium]